MVDPRRSPDLTGDSSDEATGTPRWVKVFGVLFIALLVVVVILHLTGLTPAGH